MMGEQVEKGIKIQKGHQGAVYSQSWVQRHGYCGSDFMESFQIRSLQSAPKPLNVDFRYPVLVSGGVVHGYLFYYCIAIIIIIVVNIFIFIIITHFLSKLNPKLCLGHFCQR